MKWIWLLRIRFQFHYESDNEIAKKKNVYSIEWTELNLISLKVDMKTNVIEIEYQFEVLAVYCLLTLIMEFGGETFSFVISTPTRRSWKFWGTLDKYLYQNENSRLTNKLTQQKNCISEPRICYE